MSIYYINEINKSDSRLAKEAAIREAYASAVFGLQLAHNFLTLVKYAYDPYITFGVKKVPMTDGYIGMENPWEDFIELLDKLRNRDLTGNRARDEINFMSQRFDSEEWTFCASVIKKDLRCGASEKTFNKICKGSKYEIPEFGCQLALNSEDHKDSLVGKKYVEKKLDGTRMLLVVEPIYDPLTGFRDYTFTAYSRNGKVYENFDHIGKALCDQLVALIPSESSYKWARTGFVLDGEVMSSDFQSLMKQARRKKDVDVTGIEFNVFDFVPLIDFRRGFWNANQVKRKEALSTFSDVFAGTGCINLMDYEEIDLYTDAGKDRLKVLSEESIKNGYEGVIVKAINAPYECKRSQFWLKWKMVYSYDLMIVGIEEGTGKHTGKLGAFVCEGIDEASGKHIVVNVGSGFTDEERELYFDQKMIGKMVEIDADAITQNADGTYSLRFPRFNRIRNDKS